MMLRRVINKPPRNEPKKPKGSNQNKCWLPAPEMKIQPNDKHWSYRTADGRSAIKERHGPTSLLLWKPFRDNLRRSRPIGGFTQTEEEAKEYEASQSRSQRSQHRN